MGRIKFLLYEVTEGLNETVLYGSSHNAWLTVSTYGTWLFLLWLSTGHFKPDGDFCGNGTLLREGSIVELVE